MKRIAFKQMVEAAITPYKAFPDFVPESAALPAVSYSHISSQFTRVKQGLRSGRTDTWRISIIADTRLECDTIQSLLLALDASSNTAFQFVEIIYETDNPAGDLSDQYVSLVDVRTFDKG